MSATQWDSREASALKGKHEGLIQLRLLISGLADLHEEERKDFTGRLGDLIGRNPDGILPGKRNCENSPIDHCIHEAGLHNSDCLFCGQPYEQPE